MDKIWYRNPLKSKVIGRCGRDEKTERPCTTDKSRTLKKYIKKILTHWYILLMSMICRSAWINWVWVWYNGLSAYWKCYGTL